jgi:hypothetical protein
MFPTVKRFLLTRAPQSWFKTLNAAPTFSQPRELRLESQAIPTISAVRAVENNSFWSTQTTSIKRFLKSGNRCRNLKMREF